MRKVITVSSSSPDTASLAPASPERLWPLPEKAAIFDFDGTVSDTASLWEEVDRAFLAKRAIPYTVDFPRKLSALGFAEGARYTVERYHLDEDPDDIVDEWMRMSRALYVSKATLRPSVTEYLEALREAGIPYALATTNTPDLLESMHRIDIVKWFPVRVYGQDVTRSKAFPDIYEEAARRMGVAAPDCIVFEDLAQALISANRAGCTTCAVNSGDALQNVAEVRRIADIYLVDWRDIPLGSRSRTKA